MNGFIMFIFLFLYLFLSMCECLVRPNIIMIIADDLGWNDVGFHGSNEIPTPNIDALAVSGLMLQNYYVTPICTPSRAALMTGKYPIHTGMQHSVIYGAEPRGLPLSEKLLPQYLQDIGYKTHLVGKWHLGSFKREYLPMKRGFDSHIGFWTGKIDMYDHTNQERGYWGFDFRRGFSVAHDLFGEYATDIFTNEAIKVIDSHNKSDSLFLMLSHSAVHSGNPSEFIRAPDNLIANFPYIKNFQRRKYAAVLTKLDESVGKVVAALQSNGLLENSIIIFTTDNGGPAAGFNDNAASNYPLRGVKNTLWEGGVRGAGVLWSPLIERNSRVATQRFHLVDWLPTLLAAVGHNIDNTEELDGINQWDALSKDLKSERVSVVHNIDDIFGSASITVGQWKLLKGTNYNGAWDHWYGPSGRDGHYDVTLVQTSPAGLAIDNLTLMPDKNKILELRETATIQCNITNVIICNPLEAPCLFKIVDDPCELKNLANEEPEMLKDMLEELDRINRTAIPPNNEPLDPTGNPKYWGHVLTNFRDYRNPNLNTLC